MKLFGIILLLFLSTNLYGQSNTLSITLEKALEISIENNNDLRKIKLNRDKAEKQVGEAYGTSVFPNINGNVNYNRALKQGVFFIETPSFSGSFPQGTKNTLTASVSLEQPLFTGALFLAVRIANTFAEVSKKNYDNAKLKLISDVKTSFYNVQLAKELIKLGELNLMFAEKNLADTKSMYKAGLVSEYDFQKANVQYRNLIPALTEVKNQFQISKNTLKLLMGIENSTQLSFKDSLEYKEYGISDFEDLKSELLKNNKGIQQLELNKELMDLTASYQFTKHYPELQLTGQWQAQAQENDTKAFKDWFYANSVYVGVAMKIPIFDGLATSSRVEQAEIDAKIADEDLKKIKLVMKNELQTKLLNIKKNNEQIDAYSLSVDETLLGYNIAKKRFKNGLNSQLEVVNAQIDFISAKINYLTSIKNYLVNIALLEELLATQY